jgi:hypothetical protein
MVLRERRSQESEHAATMLVVQELDCPHILFLASPRSKDRQNLFAQADGHKTPQRETATHQHRKQIQSSRA